MPCVSLQRKSHEFQEESSDLEMQLLELGFLCEDAAGNVAQIDDDAQQTIFFNGSVVSPSQKFEYDALYRLVKATGREHVSVNADGEPEAEGYNAAQISPQDGSAMQNYSREWEYDSVGNILSMIHKFNGSQWTRRNAYATDSNRLNSTAVGQTAANFSYNAHGSMASMPHLSAMDWDFAEKLCHITRGTTEAYYNYDGNGIRTRKVVVKNGVTETRLYLGGFEIWRKTVNGVLDTERETLHVMDDQRRIALVETLTVENGNAVANPLPVLRYQLDNHLGSASLELDESASIISYEEYYPYGDTSYRAGRNASEVSRKRYRYTGKEKDEESSLYYCEQRYYAAHISRWVSTDPTWLEDGINLYAYVHGNPVSGVDPSGTQTVENDKIEPVLDGPSNQSNDIEKKNTEAIYVINPKTGKAELKEQGNANSMLPKKISVLRNGRKSNSSEKTIDEINDPSKAPSPLVRYALEKLQADAVAYDGKFPKNYYVAFSKAVIKEAISLYGPDQGIKQAKLTFGEEVRESPSKAPFHVFESIVKSGDNFGWDKVQHFVQSATLQYQYGKKMTDFLQYGKEIIKDEVPSWFSDDIGFDSEDMLANNQGQAYGQHLFELYHPKMSILRKFERLD